MPAPQQGLFDRALVKIKEAAGVQPEPAMRELWLFLSPRHDYFSLSADLPGFGAVGSNAE